MTLSALAYPEKIGIAPLAEPPQCAIRVPGSKSITNRALVLAALAGTQAELDSEASYNSVLTGALKSEDTEVMVESLKRLGVHVSCRWESAQVGVAATAGRWPKDSADLYVANSGTTMRFLTAMVSLRPGKYRLDGVARMRERPIQDLLAALQQLGVDAKSEGGNGCPPVIVETNGIKGGRVQIKGNVSSQFLSGLLMAAPLATGETIIEVEGTLVSQPYVTMTVEMIRQFGAKIDKDGSQRFVIPGNQHYKPQTYAIEPDASAASYFAAAAAITGGEIAIPDLKTPGLQGDVRFLDVLEQMGSRVIRNVEDVVVKGDRLRGVDVDMNDISDTVMTLAAVACFAEGPTTIRNVGHIRHKETDRITALATEIRRLGGTVEERDDGLTITPSHLEGADVETYEDHRMAMSLALVGLRIPGVFIKNPGCVAKTYPEFFQDLEKL